MIDYPLEFEDLSEAEEGDESWSSTVGEVSVPEEFGGGDAPSPEKLFAASIGNCVLATFKTIAERKGIGFESVEAETSAVLDRSDGGRPMITEAEVVLSVKGAEDLEKVRGMKETVEENCFIHRSVETGVEVRFEV